MSILNASLPYSLTALPLVGSFITSTISRSNDHIKEWYNKKLIKPKFKPPNWVFGPVWTGLYLSMGYASYLVYRDGVGEARNTALALYAGQLALNWAWTPIFFKYHKLGLSVAVILLMGANIAACIWKFQPINQTAAYLMYPYMAWVTFATYANTAIWLLNKNKDEKSN